jgi:hypothetical protein
MQTEGVERITESQKKKLFALLNSREKEKGYSWVTAEELNQIFNEEKSK